MLKTVAVVLSTVAASVAAFKQGSVGESDMQVVYDRFIKDQLPKDSSTLASMAAEVADDYLPHFNSSCLFDDIDYHSTRAAGWPVMSHLSRLSVMATVGRAGVNESKLAPKVVCGLDWWLVRRPVCSNWYDQEISGPNNIGSIMLMLPNGSLSANQSAAAGELVAEAKWWEGWTGSNLLFMLRAQLMRGLYFSNQTLVAQSFQVAFSAMHTFDQNTDGPQDDHSFHQHGPQLLAGSYGSEFTGHVLEFAFLGQGTQWQAPQDALNQLSSLLLDGQQFMMVFDTPHSSDPATREREISWDWQVVGRSTSDAPGVSDPRGFISPTYVSFISQSNATGRQGDWQAFSARLNGTGPAAALQGSRSYWDSDFVAHAPVSGNWRFSLHMHSSRTIGGACVNDQGKLSRRKSNGATALYYTGREYENTFPLWNFYRPPGVTGPVGGSFELDCGNAKSMGGSGFVGGVSLPSGRSFAVMDVNDEDEMTGHRSWFIFDDAVVAMGSKLKAHEAGAAFETTLDTARLRGDVFAGNVSSSSAWRKLASSDPLPQGDTAFPLSSSAGSATWLLHNNTGYIMPTDSSIAGPSPPAELKVWNQPKTGNWYSIGVDKSNVTEDLFDGRLAHTAEASSSDTGASFAYVIVPAVSSPDAMAGIAKAAAGLTIVRSQTPGADFAAQEAVLDEKAGVLGVAVWSANAGSSGPGSSGFHDISAGPGWSFASTVPGVMGMDVSSSTVTLAIATPGTGGATGSVYVDRALACSACHAVPGLAAGKLRGEAGGGATSWTRVDFTTPGGDHDGNMMGAPTVIVATESS